MNLRFYFKASSLTNLQSRLFDVIPLVVFDLKGSTLASEAAVKATPQGQSLGAHRPQI
jgi:hypothetical protein